MKAVPVSPVDEWFRDDNVPEVSYSKTFEEAEWDPLLVLHTSGSTGIPKPVIVRQGMVAIGDAFHNLPEWNGNQNFVQALVDKSKLIFLPSIDSFLLLI
jgi:acyl-coenzyme A synthetase/AMP-(fatty) acid ligase